MTDLSDAKDAFNDDYIKANFERFITLDLGLVWFFFFKKKKRNQLQYETSEQQAFHSDAICSFSFLVIIVWKLLFVRERGYIHALVHCISSVLWEFCSFIMGRNEASAGSFANTSDNIYGGK